MLAAMSLAMLPSALVSFICGEINDGICFLAMAAAGTVLGITLSKEPHYYRKKLRISDGFFAIAVCWFLASLAGGAPYLLTGVLTDPMSAFFESASGFTTTGATVLRDIQELNHGILLWRAMTGWLGGLSILLFGIALMPTVGLSAQRLTVIETHAAMESISPKMIQNIRVIGIFYGSITILETILLRVSGMRLFDALLVSMSTVSTTGFARYDEGMMHFGGNLIPCVIIVFMLLSGVNYNLYLNAVREGLRAFRQNTEFNYYIIITAICSFLITVFVLISDNGRYLGNCMVEAVFQTVSMITSTGFCRADYNSWPQAAQFILLILAFTGACSSSSGSGIKIARLVILLKLIRHGISMRLHPNFVDTIRLNQKPVPSEVVSAVATVPFLFLTVLFASTFLMTLGNASVSEGFSSSLACLCNTGCYFGGAGPMHTFDIYSGPLKFLLSIVMIGGRLELYTLLVLFTPSYWEQSY